jgi:phosphonopyruvate decarboxylase
MIQAEDFIKPAKALGFNTWTGVPCSFLTPFINRIISDPAMSYISSANEGDAVATATGSALAGQPAVAMMQNSGLGNAVSPLSSLNWVFRIPILLIITLRGENGLPDEPQHELMGQITAGMLDQLQIPWTWFPRSAADIEGALMVACWQMEKTARPYAFIMRQGSVAPGILDNNRSSAAAPKLPAGETFAPDAAVLTRRQALQCVIEETSETESLVIGTTGFTGRELFALSDRSNHFYMVGSMGCAASFGLGVSLALPGRKIVVVDGDGAALMRMGNFATIGAYAGPNLLHLLLDNCMHESTGGQPTVSASVNFAAVAGACAYREAQMAVTLDALRRFMTNSMGPALLQLRTRSGQTTDLPRPGLLPHQVRTRLMQNIGVTTPWMNA